MGEATDRPDVVVGLAETALGLTAAIARVALLPGRLIVAGSFAVEPTLRGARDGLASAGRRRLETAAAGVLAAPETARTLDRALTGPVPQVIRDETVERLVRDAVDSPSFERIVREVAESQAVRNLTEEALHSAELQRAVEEVLAGPGVRNALRRETRTLWDEVAARMRQSANRLDAAFERAVRRAFKPRQTALPAEESPYGGLVSRGAAFLVDAGITQLTVLVVGALVALLASFLGVSTPGWLTAALAGAGWALFVGGYFALFWTTAGQTPGMRMLGLRVVHRDGRPLGAGRAFVRLAASMLAIAPFAAGFLPVLVDGRRRALQDFVAQTVVVRDEAAGVSVQRGPSTPR